MAVGGVGAWVARSIYGAAAAAAADKHCKNQCGSDLLDLVAKEVFDNAGVLDVIIVTMPQRPLCPTSEGQQNSAITQTRPEVVPTCNMPRNIRK